jgi:hypothetical protein
MLEGKLTVASFPIEKPSPEFAKTWRKKTDCKQSEKDDTEEIKYFSITGHLQEEDSANTKGSDLDNTEILRKETRKTKSLMDNNTCSC